MKYANKEGGYQNMIDNIDDFAIIQLDEKGIITNWNKEAEKIKGYNSGEVIGNNFKMLFSQEEQEKLLPERLLEEAREKGKATYNGLSVRKDGTIYWTDSVFTSLYDEAKKVIGFTKIIRDLNVTKNQIEFEHNNLHALINNLKGMMWSVDKDYKLITSNRAFGEVLKKISGETINKGDCVLNPEFSQGFGREKLNVYQHYYDQALAGKTFTIIEYTALPFERWNEISFQPIRKGDEIYGAACYSQDITEKKIAEEKLKSNEQRFRALIENSDNAVAIQSHTGKLIYVSPNVYKVLGYTDIEFMQIDISSIVHPDDMLPGTELLEKALENLGVPVHFTGRKRHKNGDWRWIEATVTNMLNNPGINGLVTNFRDVTPKKLAEEKLKHSESRLIQAQKIAHFGSWELDFSTGIALWSDEHCKIFGLPLSDNKHSYKSWLSFIHPDDLEYVMKVITESETTHSNMNFYHRIVRRDGTIRHIHLFANYEFKNNRIPAGLYGVAYDITDIKKA